MTTSIDHTATQACSTETPKDRFVCFMRGRSGRVARAALGLTLIAVGLLAIGGTAGTIVAAFGLVPIASGATGVCPLGPLFGTDFRGNVRGTTP
jgi:hypothetical protein